MCSWDEPLESVVNGAPPTDNLKYISIALPNLKRTVTDRPPAAECVNIKAHDPSLAKTTLGQCFPGVANPPMYVDVWLILRDQVCRFLSSLSPSFTRPTP